MLTSKMCWLVKIMTSIAKIDKVSKRCGITLGQKAKNKSSAIYSLQGNKTENKKHLGIACHDADLYNINLFVLLNEVQYRMSRIKGY